MAQSLQLSTGLLLWRQDRPNDLCTKQYESLFNNTLVRKFMKLTTEAINEGHSPWQIVHSEGIVETCDLVPWWDCTSFLPVVTGCSPLSVLSLLLLAPLGGAIFRVLGELHLMFLSFQGGNLIFSMGGIWRPRPGQEPSLHEQEWGWTWPPRKSGSSPAGGVSRPVHCLLSVALSLQMLS